MSLLVLTVFVTLFFLCRTLTIQGIIAQQTYEFTMKGITCDVRGVIVSLVKYIYNMILTFAHRTCNWLTKQSYVDG